MPTGVLTSQPKHRLGAPCGDCQCAQWLHTEKRCLTLRLVGGTPRAPKLARCECVRRRKDFT